MGVSCHATQPLTRATAHEEDEEMAFDDKTAADLLDMACQREKDKKTRQAEMLLNLAIKRDQEEAKAGSPSLPRKVA